MPANDSIENAVDFARWIRGRPATPAAEVLLLRIHDGAEAQRIQHGDRPRAHRKNIAQDSADAGGRALKRLHVAGMVVRFDLERRAKPVADIHHAGVFARALALLASLWWAGAADARGWICRSSARSTSR